VEALAQVRAAGIDAELRLAGSVGHAGYAQQLEALIGARGLHAHVTLLGRLGVEQVQRELAAASVFALVSLEENSPMGIEEAMAAGVPIVTSNRCGMPYMVHDGETGFLVDPHDSDDIARRIGLLLADADLRRVMGARARQVALDRFHPARIAQKTVDVYRRAIRDHERRANPRIARRSITPGALIWPEHSVSITRSSTTQ
jgi:glycosyltransferase involved in cell wall biosynthesis